MVEAEYRLMLGIPFCCCCCCLVCFSDFVVHRRCVHGRRRGKTLYNHIPRRNNIVVPTPAACKRAS
jgi:hypothetical protein